MGKVIGFQSQPYVSYDTNLYEITISSLGEFDESDKLALSRLADSYNIVVGFNNTPPGGMGGAEVDPHALEYVKSSSWVFVFIVLISYKFLDVFLEELTRNITNDLWEFLKKAIINRQNLIISFEVEENKRRLLSQDPVSAYGYHLYNKVDVRGELPSCVSYKINKFLSEEDRIEAIMNIPVHFKKTSTRDLVNKVFVWDRKNESWEEE